MSNEKNDTALCAAIEKGIKEHGFYLICVSDANLCEMPDCDHKHNDPAAMYTELEDAYVYTVGRRTSNRPEMIIFCGPSLGERPVSGGALIETMLETTRVLNYLIENWDEQPVLPGHTISAGHGHRIYKVIDNPTTAQQVKTEFMIQTSNYYNSDDYEVLVIKPITIRSTLIH